MSKYRGSKDNRKISGTSNGIIFSTVSNLYFITIKKRKKQKIKGFWDEIITLLLRRVLRLLHRIPLPLRTV
ncbi:MAG: hypothetical protein ACQEQM_09250, partial [Thermoplasmatota archaeon]